MPTGAVPMLSASSTGLATGVPPYGRATVLVGLISGRDVTDVVWRQCQRWNFTQRATGPDGKNPGSFTTPCVAPLLRCVAEGLSSRG